MTTTKKATRMRNDNDEEGDEDVTKKATRTANDYDEEGDEGVR